MQVSKEENEARLNLLECLDDNDMNLYLSGVEKNLQQSQSNNNNHINNNNYEIDSWGNERSINILSSLGDNNNHNNNSRKYDNNNSSSQSSKTQIDSKTNLSQRFLQNNRRQHPNNGQSSNLQTVYSSLTHHNNNHQNNNNNSQINRIMNINETEDNNRKNNNNSSIQLPYDNELHQSLLQNSVIIQQNNNKSYSKQNYEESDYNNNVTENQIYQDELHNSGVFMTPNYIEHRKQLQVGMLIDRHNLKNGNHNNGNYQSNKTNESITFNDKQLQIPQSDITSLSMIIGEGGSGNIQMNVKNKQKSSNPINKLNNFKAIQCKQMKLTQQQQNNSNPNSQRSNKNIINNGENDLFRCLNYYDVVDIPVNENLETLTLKNDIKKYKNLRPGTYIMSKKESPSNQQQNIFKNQGNQINYNNTLDLNNLKLLQNTTTSAPFHTQRTWLKNKQNQVSQSEERPLTERQKNNHYKNETQNNNHNLKIGLNIEQIRIPNTTTQTSQDKFYSQTSRNSLSFKDASDFSEKFRESISMQTPTAYSPLKVKFQLLTSQQHPLPQPQKKIRMRSGGGFNYEKEEYNNYNYDQRDPDIYYSNIQQQNQQQYPHPIEQFKQYEKTKEMFQQYKMQKKEIEQSQIQQDLNIRESAYSPTQVVNKYTKLMKEDNQFKKNVYFVNKKLNRLERKKTIEEFRIRSSSPIAQIIEAVNQNPLFKQNQTFYHAAQTLKPSQIQAMNRKSLSPTSSKSKKNNNNNVQQEIIPNHLNDTLNTFVGSSQYTKYRKWKGSPLFNLENNDLNRNIYINSGYSPLLTSNQITHNNNINNNNNNNISHNKQKDKFNNSLNQSSISTLYNPQHNHILHQNIKDSAKIQKIPTMQ